jgi:hypothetical protein
MLRGTACAPRFSVRIEPQISAFASQPIRLASHQTEDRAVRSSLSLREQRVASAARCDRYDGCGDGPGAISYAAYLEKQNQHKPVTADLASAPAAKAPPSPEQSPPADTGLGLKLGDIPSPDLGAQRVHEQVIRAYQVQRYSPAGSLVDVTI